MSNVLNEAKKQQVLALGKLGWTLRRIEQATGVRRETAGAYLKAAGVAVRPLGKVSRLLPKRSGNCEFPSDFGKSCPEIVISVRLSPKRSDTLRGSLVDRV